MSSSPSPETPSGSAPRNLADLVAILRRRIWVIILSTAALATIAFLASSHQAKVYQASASLLLNRQDLGAELTGVSNPVLSGDPARFAQTAAEVARSSQVARLALRQARITDLTAEDLLADSSVTPRLNADLLEFAVKNHDPLVAERLANTYADAFAQYKLELDTADIVSARAQLTSRIARLRAQGDTSSGLYRSLAASEQQLRTMQLLQSKNVVLNSTGGGKKVAPMTLRTTFFGAVLGFFVGIAIAFLWEALDTRLRSGQQIEDVLGLPLLARLPAPPRRLAPNQLAMMEEPAAVYADCIRILRSNLDVVNANLSAHSVLITSCSQREGKSTTIANLAVAFARAGRNVALVDLDLRQPALGKYFNLADDAVGVADVALDGVALEEAIQLVNVTAPSDRTRRPATSREKPPRLSVLAAGRPLDNPSEFASSEALHTLLSHLNREFDLVLIDAPPMGIVGDAVAIAPYVDALLVVVREGMTQRRAMRDLVRELDLVSAAKLGFVLTGADVQERYETAVRKGPATTEQAAAGAEISQLKTRRSRNKAPWVVTPPPAQSEVADRPDTPG
jgi:polysaccharide biosynthesis transport protein